MTKKNNLPEEKPEKVFSEVLPKTLRSNFGWKTIQPIDLATAFEELSNMIFQLELFLPAPVKISDYTNRLDILSYRKINLLAKSYIKINIFAKESYLMSAIKT